MTYWFCSVTFPSHFFDLHFRNCTFPDTLSNCYENKYEIDLLKDFQVKLKPVTVDGIISLVYFRKRFPVILNFV